MVLEGLQAYLAQGEDQQQDHHDLEGSLHPQQEEQHEREAAEIEATEIEAASQMEEWAEDIGLYADPITSDAEDMVVDDMQDNAGVFLQAERVVPPPGADLLTVTPTKIFWPRARYSAPRTTPGKRQR